MDIKYFQRTCHRGEQSSAAVGLIEATDNARTEVVRRLHLATMPFDLGYCSSEILVVESSLFVCAPALVQIVK